MIDPKRDLNSLTITPESSPFGAFTAVTAGTRRIRREQFQTERRACRAGRARKLLCVVHQLVHAQ
jgi:hypothetical protein